MSTHNIYFYGELTKIIIQLSSNTLIGSSAASGRELLMNSLNKTESGIIHIIHIPFSELV